VASLAATRTSDDRAAKGGARAGGKAALGIERRLVDAKGLADGLPDLLVEANRVAQTVIAGWHGRRRPGQGETFWQFRPFIDGEPAARVDWRRSARDDHLFVREREWEAAHTLWLTADLSASMVYRSKLSSTTKRDRALVLLLALAEVAARAGERVGLVGLSRPIASRNAAERLAATLAVNAAEAEGRTALPEPTDVRRFSDVVAIGDLLDPLAGTVAWVETLARRGVQGTLVQVLDPVEETFPFDGRTEFRDPETGQRIVAGRAETWAEAYRSALAAHRDALTGLCRRIGWTLVVHHTDRPASEVMIAIHARLSGGAVRAGT
jgi:uncharacterized protein (DUF58 family)